jgi:LmbE family N-acetylglucosaminyl deacetylase
MRSVPLVKPGDSLSILCFGAHADDIDIGAGGALLTWIGSGANLDVHWCVASATGEREREARNSAGAFLAGAARFTIETAAFRDSYMPYEGAALKAWIEAQKLRMTPDIVLTHFAHDAHQDHQLLSALTWNAFRDSVILEYEIPKWDGDLGQPNVFVALEEAILSRKISLLNEHFRSQRSKSWFDAETFRGLARIRGVECRARYAEAFHARKLRLS